MEQNDFLVIGGGIAGVSVGARLAELGRVVLLEAEEGLGYHASGRSAALFEESYGLPATIALNQASAAFHREIDGGVLSPRGLLLLGTEETAEAFSADMVSMDMTELSVAEARDFVPILDPETVCRAGYHAEAWDIDTDRLIQVFARQIRGNGEVFQGVRVDQIERLPDGWRVRSGGREWQARMLVNAAGAWADQVAQMAGVAPVGLHPLRRSMARIAAPGGHDISRWPMIFGAGESWYAKPDAGALLVSPADETPSEPMDAWPEDMDLAEGLALYQEHVTEEVTRPIASWAGLRTFAGDRCLVLGRDGQVPDFIWVAGQGGYGFQTSPAASKLVADLVAGRRPEIDAAHVAAMDPRRFG